MNGCNEQRQTNCTTEEYERYVLHTFVQWYQQGTPTIQETSAHAYSIARDTVNRLTSTHVISLLQEHPEWVQKKLEGDDSERFSMTIREITRRHFVKYLETVMQEHGLKAVYAAMTETSRM